MQERVAKLLEESGGQQLERRGVLEHAIASGALDEMRAAAFELLVEARTERAAAFFSRMHRGEMSREIDRLSDPAVRVEDVRRALRGLIDASARALHLGHPLRLLIAGRPNAGKSTLFNRLVERERVTVSSRAGTTRDLVRETISLDDFPVELIDSAGLRERGADPVESEAIRRVREERADAVVFLIAPPWNVDEEARRFLERFDAGRRLVVGNFRDESDANIPENVDVAISALGGVGVDELRRLIGGRFLGSEAPDLAAPFTERQVSALKTALRALDSVATAAALDECRSLLIIGLRSSWP
jgi:tRNA modification GTPase